MSYGKPHSRPCAELLSGIEAKIPVLCFCGKTALYMVPNKREFDGFCAEHKEDADVAYRSRHRVRSTPPQRQPTDFAKHKHEPFKRIHLSDK